jgi:hypothetical protein
LRTRWKPAAVNTPASKRRVIQPYGLSGFASSSVLPVAAKTLPPRKFHSSSSSWFCSTSARKALEIVAEPLLDGVEPRVPPVVGRMDAGGLEEVVLNLLQDQRVEVTARFVPVRCLAGFERDELCGEPCAPGSFERRSGCVGVCVPVEGVLELVVGE